LPRIMSVEFFLTCFKKGCPLRLPEECELPAPGRGPGLALVELAMHLISRRYASIACCVVGLEGGPSAGTPKAIIVFPVSLVGALAGLRCSFNWSVEKKADHRTSSRRSWVGPRIPGAKHHLLRLIDGHLGLHARALVSKY
jgi:hypothetical protein